MLKWFFSVFFCSSMMLFGEVYDCFTFFNELELLKLRFEELYDVVDHFVIVESPISFTGKKKPLFFAENQDQFEKYKDKIIHVVINEYPGLTGDPTHDHWWREECSRNGILEGLNNCNDDDIIFISDLDEIPKASAVKEIQSYLDRLNSIPFFKKRHRPFHGFVCTLEMRLFMYQLDFENLKGWRDGSKAVPYWFLKTCSPWEIKLFHHKYSDMHLVQNAGWHFNTMGGKERSLFKWIYTGPHYNNEDALNRMLENEALLDETYNGCVAYHTILVPIDDTYPRYILENLDYFRSIGWISDE